MDTNCHNNYEADRRSITLRQREVRQLLAEGRSMKEVVYLLNVTPRTVAFHKYTPGPSAGQATVLAPRYLEHALTSHRMPK